VSACSPSIEAGVPGTATTSVRSAGFCAAAAVASAIANAHEPTPLIQRFIISASLYAPHGLAYRGAAIANLIRRPIRVNAARAASSSGGSAAFELLTSLVQVAP
jgi:hypothetical protein